MKIYVSHSSSYDYINEIYNPIINSDISKTNTFFFLSAVFSSMHTEESVLFQRLPHKKYKCRLKRKPALV